MPNGSPIDPTAIQSLRDRIRGEVLHPGDSGYEEARTVWNGRIDRRPGAIARCLGTADVIASVNLARENGLLLSVRSGGHDYAGNSVCDGGLVIDLSAMKGIRVDPESRTARVQPGVTWGALDHETQAFGLATTGGTVSTVGVAGYTLGGGTGHLVRKFGLGLDNLTEVDVVTADGKLVTTSERKYPDLFWALRGGSGNFGIVTSLQFDLHEVGPAVLAGQILYPLQQAGEVLRYYREFMKSAPDELQCYAFLFRVPPLDVFPTEFHGSVVLDLIVAYAGGAEEGELAIQPLRTLGSPFLTAIQVQPYVFLQQTFDSGTPKGLRWYSRAHYFPAITDEMIDTLLSHAERMKGPFTMVYFEPFGGAVARVEKNATAFPHRDAAYGFHIFPGWSDPAEDDETIQWARSFHDAMTPFASGGVYVNLLGDDERQRVPFAYGGNYDRLVELKRKYDPENLFRMNHNIGGAPDPAAP